MPQGRRPVNLGLGRCATDHEGRCSKRAAQVQVPCPVAPGCLRGLETAAEPSREIPTGVVVDTVEARCVSKADEHRGGHHGAPMALQWCGSRAITCRLAAGMRPWRITCRCRSAYWRPCRPCTASRSTGSSRPCPAGHRGGLCRHSDPRLRCARPGRCGTGPIGQPDRSHLASTNRASSVMACRCRHPRRPGSGRRPR
jgi:hypothetical protein